MHRIGIVFPVINCYELTLAAINSIKTKHEKYVVLVDNGSVDDTVRWARNGGKEFIQETIANGENKGLTIAWNQGVEAGRVAGCDLILLANNDILFHPMTIDNLVTSLDNHSDWGMATGINDKGWCEENGGPQAIFKKEIPADETFSEHPDFSCFMFRLSVYDKIGPFDEEFSRRGKAYYEDNDYHTRMIRAGVLAVSTNQAPYYHYASMTIAKNGMMSVRSEANRAYYVEKWGGPPHAETYQAPFNK